MKFGVTTFANWHLALSMKYVRPIELLDYDQIWMNCHIFDHDPFVFLAAAACETRKVRLGTNVCPMRPHLRRPEFLAASIASLNELSAGRAVLGVGSGGSTVAGIEGGKRKNPVLTQREGVLIIKSLLSGETVTFQGEVFRIKDAKLINPDPRIPVLVGAAGPKMMQMTAEVADGVICPRVSFSHHKKCIKYYLEGLQSAGRKLSDVDVMANVLVYVSDDKDQIIKTMRPLVARMVGRGYSRYLYSSEFMEAVRKDPDLVTYKMMEDHLICGNSEDCIKRVKEYSAIGFDQLNLTFRGYGAWKDEEKTWWETIKVFGESVIPAFKES